MAPDPMEWYSLSEAADLLGVHFTTLRRWADQGLIEVMRTPGGKRKFHRTALEAFLNRSSQPAVAAQQPFLLESSTVDHTRMDVHQRRNMDPAWLTRMSETHLAFFRQAGSRLVALVIQYCSRSDSAEAFLEDGRQITREYGRVSYELGLSVDECLELFLFFRRPMLRSIHETGSRHSSSGADSMCVFNKMSHFLDEAMLAMVVEYEHCRNHPNP